MRRDVEERLDRVLREALVVEPPPELQVRLMALVRSAPVVLQPAAPERRGSLWLDPNVWLSVAALAALAWSSWSVLSWLAGFSLLVGDVPEALVVIVSSPVASLLPTLGIDLTSMVLWCVVGAVVWVLSASGAQERPAPGSGARRA
jgi:hypothetical protein